MSVRSMSHRTFCGRDVENTSTASYYFSSSSPGARTAIMSGDIMKGKEKKVSPMFIYVHPFLRSGSNGCTLAPPLHLRLLPSPSYPSSSSSLLPLSGENSTDDDDEEEDEKEEGGQCARASDSGFVLQSVALHM